MKLAALALLAAPVLAQNTPYCSLEEDRLVMDPEQSWELIGESVAIDGDLAIGGGDSNWVVFWRRTGTTWVQTQRVEVPDAGFGHSVDLSGTTAAIGARYDGFNSPGSVRVWEFDGATWSESQVVTPSDPLQLDRFGSAVALDGDVLLVGTDPFGANPDLESAYVFRRVGGTFVEEQELFPSTGPGNLGFAMALDVEGDRCAIGALADGTGGAVHVYERSGGTWAETQIVSSPSLSLGAQLGVSVSLDGDRFAAGAQFATLGGGAGAAFVFELVGGTWIELDAVTPGDVGPGDRFGSGVALQGDRLVVGKDGDDVVDFESGSAYLYALRGGAYVFQKKFVPSNPVSNGRYGTSVALDGDTALIGAPNAAVNSFRSGVVYVERLGASGLEVGFGKWGTGGLVPKLEVGGCAAPGGAFSLDVTQGLGGAPGLLLLGATQAAIPFAGGTVHVGPPLAGPGTIPHVLGGAAGVAGAGTASFPFALVDASFSGVSVYAQAGYLDPGASGGVSLSSGVEVRFP